MRDNGPFSFKRRGFDFTPLVDLMFLVFFYIILNREHSFQREVRQFKEQLGKYRLSVIQLKRENRELRGKNISLHSALQRHRRLGELYRKKLSEKDKKYRALLQKLRRLDRELARCKRDYSAFRERAERERRLLQSELLRARERSAALEVKLENFKEKLSSLNKILQKLSNENQKLTSQISDYRQNLAKKELLLALTKRNCREKIQRFQKNEQFRVKELAELQQKLQAVEKKLISTRSSLYYLQNRLKLLEIENKKLLERNKKLYKRYLSLKLNFQSLADQFQRESQLWKGREKELNKKLLLLKQSYFRLQRSIKNSYIHSKKIGVKEKGALLSAYYRYFSAILIYLKGDHIVGYRDYPEMNFFRFENPIELTRRDSKGHLVYRRRVDSKFLAFSELEALLPSRIVSNLETVYIFIFDDRTTAAAAFGLIREHRTLFRVRRAIWQF